MGARVDHLKRHTVQVWALDKQLSWTEEGVLRWSVYFHVSWPSSRCSKCNANLLPVRDLYLAFVTNFSVRSSIRLLFLSLRGERKRGSNKTDWRRNAGLSWPLNRIFSSIETYCSSASAILSRSHVLDWDCCVRERQSCVQRRRDS